MIDFEVITFDCYGTLIDWESGIIRAFQEEALIDGVALQPSEIVAAYMAEEPGVESERHRPYREVLAETARRVAARLGWKMALDRADFLPKSLGDWSPFSDTNAALERLGRRFQLGILSNVDDDLLALTPRHLTARFDLIVTAEQIKSYKPALSHFREALARTTGKRLLHAAQSYFHDVVPARKLDIPVAWVNRKAELAPVNGPRPTYEARELVALADLLGA